MLNLFLNETQIEWVTISLPLLKPMDALLFTLKGGLLLANVSVYSYLFAEIFLYVFHKRLKAIYETIYENKFKYIHDTCTELMDKFNLAKVEFSQKNEDEQVQEDQINQEDNEKVNEENHEFQDENQDVIQEDENKNEVQENNEGDDMEWKNEIINQTLHLTKDFVNEETRNLWIAAENATAEKLQNLSLQEEEELKNKIKEIFHNLSNSSCDEKTEMERICSKSCLCLNEKKIIECECHTNLETVLKTNYVQQDKQEMD